MKFLYGQQDLNYYVGSEKQNLKLKTYFGQKMYRQPAGQCIDIENFNKTITIATDFEPILYLIDPLQDNLVFTGAHNMLGDQISIHENEGYYGFASFIVDTIKNEESKDLRDCSSDEDSTYSSCILELVSHLFPGCLPPWITQANKDNNMLTIC